MSSAVLSRACPTFYRELGDLFGVELSRHNRWTGAMVLPERWRAHIDAALSRPVLIADEAQEMKADVLAELRLLSSAHLAGDQELSRPQCERIKVCERICGVICGMSSFRSWTMRGETEQRH